ncbi:hypothetical protein [Sphingomonas sp. GB1N7]|uniref:hypothetical protein n=1 Tax=Parasphingomonas caseinilytica TaxID=3096158 RepID=UPI002FCB2501
MKFIVLAAALMLPAVASAQTAAPAPSAPAAPAAATAKFTLDTPIEAIVADPAGKAVIEKDLPGTTTHPMYDQFKAMSLNQVAPMAADKITPAVLAKVQADLATIK